MDGARPTTRPSEEPWLLLALLVQFASLLWLAGSQPFDLGYGRPAELAASMLASGNWVTQRYADGTLYFDKPPVLTWLVALAGRFTAGPLTWEQWIPGLLAWLLTLAWTALLARRWFGTRSAGWMAALVVATTFGFPTLIRTKRLDPIFAALVTGSVTYGYLALVTARPGVRRSLLILAAWLLAALATLTKGPLALLFALGPVLAFAAWAGRLRRLAAPATALGAVLCVALVVAWPLLLIEDLGLRQLLAMLRDTDLTTRRGGPLFYLTNAPLRMLPWALLVPALFGWRGGDPERRRSDSFRLPLCWLLVVFVPLQFSHAKHYRYLLPAYPALALLLTALVHDEHLRGWARRWRDGTIGLVLGLLGVAGLAAPIAAVVAGARSPFGPGAAALVGVALAACAWQGLVGLRREQALRAFGFALTGASLAFAVQLGAAARSYQARDHTAVVTAAFLEPMAAGLDARTYGLGAHARGLPLIASRRLVAAADGPDALVDWLASQPLRRGVVMTTPAGAAELAEEPRLAVSRRGEAELDGDPYVFVELQLRD